MGSGGGVYTGIPSHPFAVLRLLTWRGWSVCRPPAPRETARCSHSYTTQPCRRSAWRLPRPRRGLGPRSSPNSSSSSRETVTTTEDICRDIGNGSDSVTYLTFGQHLAIKRGGLRGAVCIGQQVQAILRQQAVCATCAAGHV